MATFSSIHFCYGNFSFKCRTKTEAGNTAFGSTARGLATCVDNLSRFRIIFLLGENLLARTNAANDLVKLAWL